MAFIATLAFTCHLLAANLIQRWEMFPDHCHMTGADTLPYSCRSTLPMAATFAHGMCYASL
jgi:hypothetical protein